MIELVNPKINKKLNSEMSFNSSCKKIWLNFDKSDYLFKDNRNNSKINFGEVLYSNLCKKLDINCVQTRMAHYIADKPAYLKGCSGILVKSFLNEKINFVMNYSDMIALNNLDNNLEDVICVDDCIKNLKIYADNIRCDIDLEKFRIELYKRAILDFFLAQLDRHSDNFEFFVTNNKIEFAPMFDNGMCLSFYNTLEENKQIIKNIDRFYEDHFFTCKYKMYLNHNFYKFEHCFDDKEYSEIFTKQLALMCNENKEIKEFVSKIFKIDIISEIEKIEKEQESVLPTPYKLSAKKIFERKIDLFKTRLKKNKIELAK